MFILPVFLLGTRGDILPILKVLIHLLGCNNVMNQRDVQIVVVTHSCYIHDILNSFDGIMVIGVQVPPIVDSNSCAEVGSFDADYVDLFVQRYGVDNILLIISNLFALKSWHLSVSINVPHIIMHPNVPRADRSLRKELLDEFKTLQPALFNLTSHSSSITSSLHHDDFVNWLWPTLAYSLDERVFSRVKVIPGPVVIILDSPKLSLLDGEFPFSNRYHMCGSVTSDIDGEKLCLNTMLPTALIDTEMVASMSVSSKSESATQHQKCRTFHSTNELLDAMNDPTKGGENVDPLDFVCVDFGSMTSLLFVQDRMELLIHTLSTLSLGNRHYYVIISHGCLNLAYSIIHALSTTYMASSMLSRFLLVENSIDHSLVLPRCVAVVHHGGIGTIHACMKAGVPQVVLAVMYDQGDNIAKLERLGIGVGIAFDEALITSSLSSDLPLQTSVTGGGADNAANTYIGTSTGVSYTSRVLGGVYVSAKCWLSEALAKCCSPQQRLRCACIGRDVRNDSAEDGLNNAAELIQNYVATALRAKIRHETS